MGNFIAFFLMLACIISCGNVSDNSTFQCFNGDKMQETKKMNDNSLPNNLGTVDNKGSGWGFVKKKGEEPEIYQSTQELFKKYNTYYVDPKRSKKIYLTFDEGYENGYTAVILDILK